MGDKYKTGFLWDKEVEWERENPFGNDKSKDFAKYTELGRDEGLEIYIAKYKWYKNGKLEKAWYWNGENWEKVKNIDLDLVYDKYKFDNRTKELKKRIAEDLAVVNDPELEEICKDKLKTYRLFPEHVPETSVANKDKAEEMLENYGSFVYKPRYGFAGKGVEVIDSIDQFEGPEEPEKFVVQRTIQTDGAPMFDVEGPHDLRTVIINGDIQDGNYIRIPDEGKISNIARGGTQKYVSREELPEKIVQIIEEVGEKFEKFQPAIFSVDFMFDETGRPWVIELNSKPGTYYHHPVKEKDKELPKIKNILKMLRDKAETVVEK